MFTYYGSKTGLPTTNLVGRYRADTDVTKDGSNFVSSWGDIAGANDVTQAVGSAQPLWQDNVNNGKPAILFQGNDWLSHGTNITVGTAVVACNYTASSPFNNFDGLITGGSGNTIIIIANKNSTNIYEGFGSFGAGATWVNNVNTPDFSTFSDYKGVATKGTPIFCNKIQIGKDRSNNRFWTGYVFEILLYSTELNSTDLSDVFTYLEQYY
jgi:hypothetical protein